MTQAFFAIDRPAVPLREVRRQLRWLEHSRRTLLALVEGLPPEALLWGTPRRRGRRPGKGGGWTIWRYLRHIGGVEKWYISQLWRGLPRLPRSDSPFERLALTRSQVLEVLRHSRREDLARSTRSSGEMWTLRKVLRRLLYHERYHTRTIARILLAAGRPIPPWGALDPGIARSRLATIGEDHQVDICNSLVVRGPEGLRSCSSPRPSPQSPALREDLMTGERRFRYS